MPSYFITFVVALDSSPLINIISFFTVLLFDQRLSGTNGDDLNIEQQHFKDRIHVLPVNADHDLLYLSSTQIRQLEQSHGRQVVNCDTMTLPAIWKYIHEHQLYTE